MPIIRPKKEKSMILTVTNKSISAIQSNFNLFVTMFSIGSLENIVLYSSLQYLQAPVWTIALIGILNSFFLIFLYLPISLASFKSVNDLDISAKDSISLIIARFPRIIYTNLIASFFIFLYSLLLIIPGFIYAVRVYFISLVVLTGDFYGKSAILESKKIVKGNWWLVFTIFLVSMILVLLVSYLVDNNYSQTQPYLAIIIKYPILLLFGLMLSAINGSLFGLLKKSHNGQLSVQ